MRLGWQRRWRYNVFTPKRRTALCGVMFGAGLSLVLVAAPLWVLGGAGGEVSLDVSPAPLAALSTMPAESSQFNISNLLIGDWVGEMCPEEGEPVAVHFEFVHDQDDDILYSLTVDDGVRSEGLIGSGACDVDGEDIAFHAFLAILNDCDDACGVDRAYQGHFEEGVLTGSYTDAVVDEVCRSCVGGGTWWLEPETG